jgi:hypothetical protein
MLKREGREEMQSTRRNSIDIPYPSNLRVFAVQTFFPHILKKDFVFLWYF